MDHLHLQNQVLYRILVTWITMIFSIEQNTEFQYENLTFILDLFHLIWPCKLYKYFWCIDFTLFSMTFLHSMEFFPILRILTFLEDFLQVLLCISLHETQRNTSNDFHKNFYQLSANNSVHTSIKSQLCWNRVVDGL